MRDNRPINLNLLTIRFPVMAVASILHRVSGVLVFLFIPCLLWTLRESLLSERAFNGLKAHFSGFWAASVLWVFLVALTFHIFAGLRPIILFLLIVKQSPSKQ